MALSPAKRSGQVQSDHANTMKKVIDSRQQRKAQTRQSILNAAITTFAELGYEAASIGMIAERCELKKALIQYHFETKDKLWKEAVNHLWGQRQMVMVDYLAGESAATQEAPAAQNDGEKALSVRFVFRQIIRFAMDHPEWIGIMVREASKPGPRLDWFIETHLKDDYARGIQFVEQAQAAKLLPDLPPLHLLHIISGALFYIIMIGPLTKSATGEDPSDARYIEGYVDTLLSMLHVS